MSGLVVPGAGQLFNRQYIKGVIVVGVSLVLLVMFMVRFVGVYVDFLHAMTGPLDSPGLMLEPAKVFIDKVKVIMSHYMPLLMLIWAGAMVDAYYFGSKISEKEPPQKLK